MDMKIDTFRRKFRPFPQDPPRKALGRVLRGFGVFWGKVLGGFRKIFRRIFNKFRKGLRRFCQLQRASRSFAKTGFLPHYLEPIFDVFSVCVF